MSNRRLFWVVILATVVGIISCLCTLMHFSYQIGAPGVHYYGGVYFTSTDPAGCLTPEAKDYSSIIMAIGAGGPFTIFLTVMQRRFVGWFFHLVEYVLSGSWTMNLGWSVFLIGWLLKLIILKQGSSAPIAGPGLSFSV